MLIAVLAIGSPLVEIAVSLLAVVAVYELLHATGLYADKKLFAACLAGSACIMATQSVDKTLFAPALYLYIAALFVLFMTNRETLNFKAVAAALMITVYPSFMLGHITYIWTMEDGHLLVWVVFVCAFLTDTFAMLGGRYFGKRKLCPLLSPKKTVEGSVCGVFGCVLSLEVYCLICRLAFSAEPNYLNALVIGLAVSAVSQLGDLAASCIKREYKIKDYGKIMPGHGGVMDRFDSVLFAAPFVYYILYVLPIFK